MSKQGTIKTSTWSNTWSKNGNNVEYHKVTFEGDDKTYQIGSKDKNPAFLAVGQVLFYEAKDDKGGIKRVEPPQSTGGVGGSATFSGGYKPDTIGITVGAGVNCAVTLIANDKVELKDLEATARRIVEISLKLKEEFSNPKTA